MLYQAIFSNLSDEESERVALICGEQHLTYRQLKVRIDEAAVILTAAGLKKGDVASSYLPNSIESIVFAFACFKLGVVHVPLRIQFPNQQLAHMIQQARSKLILTDPQYNANLAAVLADDGIGAHIPHILVCDHKEPGALPLPCSPEALKRVKATVEASGFDVAADDLATGLSTSGSTGPAKIALHQHGQWLANAAHVGRDFSPADVVLIGLSVNHAYPFGEQVVPGLLNRVPLIILPCFTPQAFLASVDTGAVVGRNVYKASYFCGVPAMYKAIVDCMGPSIFPSGQLRALDCAGEMLPRHIKQALIKKFGNGVLRLSYGSTEAMCIARDDNYRTGIIAERHIYGSVKPGLSCRLVDQAGEDAASGELGALLVKGNTIAVGYLNAGAVTDQDGYYHTGDEVRLHGGTLEYFDRISQEIKNADGYKISRSEIEDVLAAQDDVSESLAVNITDHADRLLIVALVVLRQSAAKPNSLSAQSLYDLYANLPQGHRPNIVAIVPKLARSSIGKIDAKFHREQARQQYGEPAPEGDAKTCDERTIKHKP